MLADRGAWLTAWNARWARGARLLTPPDRPPAFAERAPSTSLDMQFLRWAAGEWLERPIKSSAYCKLNPEAKSTIALAFSTDGVLFASTHGDHTVKVFRCASWQLFCTLRGHRRTPWTIKFHPRDRHVLASGSLDETVRIWDLRTEQCVRTLDFDFVVSCIAFHSSGELLAVTSGRRIFLCRWQTNRTPHLALPADGSGGPPPSLPPWPPAHASLPGLLERLVDWGTSGGASAASASAAASGGADMAVAAGAGGGASAAPVGSNGGSASGHTADGPAGGAAADAGAAQPPSGAGTWLERLGVGGGSSSNGGAADGAASAPASIDPERTEANKVVILSADNPQRCVAFKRSATHELFFVAETNPETPPEPPPQPNLYQPHQAPPFTVQLFMWKLPLHQSIDDLMRMRLDTSNAVLKVPRSVMYSDAGFDVSRCGRYLALCELDPQVGRPPHAALCTRLSTRLLSRCGCILGVSGRLPLAHLFAATTIHGRAVADRRAAQLSLRHERAVCASLLRGPHRLWALPGPCDRPGAAVCRIALHRLHAARWEPRAAAHRGRGDLLSRLDRRVERCALPSAPALVRPTRLPIRHQGRPHPRLPLRPPRYARARRGRLARHAVAPRLQAPEPPLTCRGRAPAVGW